MNTIKLNKPARKGEREITELTFQEPKVKHLLAIDGKSPEAADVAFVSALSGEPETLINEIAIEDWKRILRFISKNYIQAFSEVSENESP